MKHRFIAAAALLVGGLVMAPAVSAQSIHCTTYISNQIDCDSTQSNYGALVELERLRIENAWAAQIAAAEAQAAASRPGLNYIDGNGVPRYLEQGTFLKADDGLAIYVISDQQFHAFQSWGSYLRYGGKTDLSNVVHWRTVSNWPASSFGAPVQE